MVLRFSPEYSTSLGYAWQIPSAGSKRTLGAGRPLVPIKLVTASNSELNYHGWDPLRMETAME